MPNDLKARASWDRNPFVFVVGCPRSGTTLLQRILDAHPQLAMTPETHWLPLFYRDRVGLTADGRLTPEFAHRLAGYRTFARMGIGRERLEELVQADPSASYADFVSRLYSLYGEVHGKPLVGDKTPGYARAVRLLRDLWPRARFVHLIRDGRDVALSAAGWKRKLPKLEERFPTWRAAPFATAALWWAWHVRAACEAGRALGNSFYHEVRYEDLVARPGAVVDGLCRFFGLGYDAAMLRFHEGRAAPKPGQDAKHGWLPITPGLRDWRTQMTAADVERFEAVAGDLLSRLGYPRAFPAPGIGPTQEARRVRECFPKELSVSR